MRRGVAYLVFGAAVGVLAASTVARLARKRRETKPQRIGEKIASRLELLERQLSGA